MQLVIEFGNGSRAGYGSIHRSGCTDVVDPAPIGDADSRSAAVALADETTCWASNEGECPADYGYKIAPCAALLQ
ncbi:Uncharacterised protein [Mycobacteroides abscessus subsp. massiliense]|nr:Uncharacterised protein [Mycobacteroides abscessus subsp. massiliense]SLI83362.1 Uncharacterised protein [Mycobacteroides abscessus subsp. abscessus]